MPSADVTSCSSTRELSQDVLLLRLNSHIEGEKITNIAIH